MINSALKQQIIDLLIPYMDDSDTRRPLVEGALHSNPVLLMQVLRRLDWSGSTYLFTVELVTELVEHSDLDGKPALVWLLEEVRKQSEIDDRSKIDLLLQRIHKIERPPYRSLFTLSLLATVILAITILFLSTFNLSLIMIRPIQVLTPIKETAQIPIIEVFEITKTATPSPDAQMTRNAQAALLAQLAQTALEEGQFGVVERALEAVYNLEIIDFCCLNIGTARPSVVTSVAIVSTDTPQSPSQEPTLTATATPTLIPTNVALLIFNSASGEEIGRGIVRLYAPSQVERRGDLSVELELVFTEFLLTPTPTPVVIAVAVTAAPVAEAALLAAPLPSDMPIPIRSEATGIPIYQKMGASLICNTTSFSDCGDRPPLAIELGDIPKWTWIIKPLEATEGIQTLRVELWTLGVDQNGVETHNIQWQKSFNVNVINPEANVPFKLITDNLEVILAALTSVCVGLFALYKYRNREKPPTAPPPSQILRIK